MELGTFSISLAVKNMNASLTFYGALGFEVIDGGHINDAFPDTDAHKWRILQNATTNIGLFEGMFDHNIMTFNPKDVRAIQKVLKANDISMIKEADETKDGPDHVILLDPDGNQIMFDQH